MTCYPNTLTLDLQQCFSLASECARSTAATPHRSVMRTHRFLQRQSTAEDEFDVDAEPTRKTRGTPPAPQQMTIVSPMTMQPPPQNSMIVFADEFELFRDQPVSYV